MAAKKTYYCVAFIHGGKVSGYHSCSTDEAKAEAHLRQMQRKSIPDVGIVTRATKPKGVKAPPRGRGPTQGSLFAKDKPGGKQGSLFGPSIKEGLSWDSPQGTKTIVGRDGDRFYVQTEGSRSAHIFDADDVAFEMRRDAANLAMQRTWKSKETERAAQQAAEEDAHGFYDQMTPAQAGRARKALHRSQGFNRVFSTRKKAIERMVREGWRVEGTRLVSPAGSFYDQKDITKTALDYARHLSRLGLKRRR